MLRVSVLIEKSEYAACMPAERTSTDWCNFGVHYFSIVVILIYIYIYIYIYYILCYLISASVELVLVC